MIRMFRWLFVFTFLGMAALPAQAPLTFAVIGDYGKSSQPELDVANLVKNWKPDLILTVGDNNYEYGEASTIDLNIGQYYHNYISPYIGSYGAGDSVNQFFPTLGNHDWIAAGATPYRDYFTLPGNERYYDFVRGPVHFFAIDSDPSEPDGNSVSSLQALWLRRHLAVSTSVWNIVYFHQPPYSSGTKHGSFLPMRWPFRQWGANAVLGGHEHLFERLIEDSLPYFVVGNCGKDLYSFGTPISGSVARYNADFGAERVVASEDSIRFEFINRGGTLIDSYTIIAPTTNILHLLAGWNLLSLPFAPVNPLAGEIFATSRSAAFRYAGTGYEPLDTIANGFGFWMAFDSAFDIRYHLTPVSADTVAIRAGWNLVGSIADSLPVADIQQVPPGILSTGFYGYTIAYEQAYALLPGKGYWVRASQPGEIVLKRQ
jgi:tartrate-resistant acid phosphatase type 5